MSAVALASTLHDPTAADLPALRAALPGLAHRYARMVIYATEETPDCVLEPLRAAGATVSCHPGAYSGIGGRRLGAVREAATYASAVHLCDFDRLLHWHHYYSGELTAVLARIPQTDLLLLGRTERAWATHPAQQIETEQLANRVVSRIVGADVDVCSGSRGLSRRAIDYLAAHSQERSVGTDGEWPVLLLRAGIFHWDHILTEGLEFETADRHQDDVVRAGGLAAWNAARDRDAAGWTFRVRLAGDIIMAALRATE